MYKRQSDLMGKHLYDFKAFVIAYVDAHRPNYVHKDFETFYKARLSKLEDAFNIRFSENRLPMFMVLFDVTVKCYWNTSTPGEFFLEGSALLSMLEAKESGKQLLATWDEVLECANQSQETYLQMLFDLFVFMFGEVSTVITSDDLKALGFDDSAEPKIWDYSDNF